uniref:Putative Ribosomal-protein-alanine acetyltransferase n=1 Tax=Magnetococcus massalia (strain MO-1) TaxID=451514 RepID=A0A1S7LLK5_MAGMO|nr:putative Ribosomal-protein-alanine acetyltransferase [Candidatus Magnetococcus massalia]
MKMVISETVHIEPITPALCPSLAALDLRVSPRPWTEQMFAEELELQSVALAIMAADQPLGFAIARYQYDSWHVMTIGIDPEHRRRGWGRRVMQALLADIKKRAGQTVELEVRSSNKGAIALYGALGFCQTGRRPRYYPAGAHAREDALLMQKQLDETQPTRGRV